MVKPWELLSSETVLEAGIIRVSKDAAISPRTASALNFYVVHTPDWVQVVPLTADGKLVMIRQYRHGGREICIEVPGGLIDADDADPPAAARRELLEETGYGGGELMALGELNSQPALLSNRVSVFLATNVTYLGPPKLDTGEDIEVVLVDPAQIGQMIAEGRISNGTTVMALLLAWWSRRLPGM